MDAEGGADDSPKAYGGLSGPTVSMRSYLSWNLLFSGVHLAAMARDREALDDLPSPIDQRERAYVLGAVVTATTFLDAAVNEVFQDAEDPEQTSYGRRLAPDVRGRLGSMWKLTDSGRRLSTLERYETGLLLAGADPLDRGAAPYQDAAACIQLRNWIVHYRPQDVGPALEEPRLAKLLHGRFAPNRLMAGQGNAWFPDHALGADCATWAVRSARAFADAWMARMGLEPVYHSVDEHQPRPDVT